MKKLIAWWADNHVAANLMMIGIILGGFIGYSKMERELFPTIAVPGLQIIVSWPGASPQDVEDQIVNRIEESLKDLENIDWMRSESAEGYGAVYIFADTNIEFSRILDEVSNRVSGISTFPPDVEQPRISQWLDRDVSLRIAVHGDIGERPLKRLAEDLRKEVAALKGISVVTLFGTRKEEISIEVSEIALQQYGISFDEISNAIRASSVNLSAGNLRTDGGQYSLRTLNLADTNVDFEKIIVKQLPQGGVIKLSDVATVIDGFEENEILATMNGEPAVLVEVLSSENMDVVVMSESVNNWIEERNETLPEGVSLTLWNDAAIEFNDRISTIGSAAFSGLVLVFMILLLTLRPIVAVWVAVGIATAYAGAFVFLDTVGVSLNMLSTFAFLLVLGIVVDDAIIVGERVHSEMENGNTGLNGAVNGAFLVSKPVIFGVITTIIAFLPWLFLSGTTQEYTRQIAWVVILALTFSIIEALFILPAHLSTIKPQKSLNALGRLQQKIANGIVLFGNKNYGALLNKSLQRPGLTLSIFIGLFIIVIVGLLGGNHVKSVFQPEIASEQISVNIDLREGTTYNRALQILAQLQSAQETLIAEVESNAEDSKSEVVENWYTRSRRDSVIAIVKLTPPDERNITAKDAATRLRELIGDVAEAKQISVNYAVDDVGPDLDISVRHPDLDQLQLATDELIDRLRQFSSLYDISHSLETANEEIRFQLKPGAQQLGLTLGQVMQQVRQAYYGQEVQRLPREGNDVRVMVRYPIESRQSLESFKHFRVRLGGDREVPLTSVVDLSYGPSLKKIDHWDGLRSTRVRGYLKEPIRDEIVKELEDNFYPQWEAKYPGLSREAIGQSAGEAEFLAELGRLLIIAFFAMYCMLAIAFKSYSQPALILVAIPFAVVGAVIGHFLLGLPISIWSYFGAVAATGVVVNDNLVLIDSYNSFRKQGQSVIDAIQDACRNRFRPILITSITTFIGLVPLMLERSSQAAWLQPTVVALAFGLVVAFFVTLFLVPAILVFVDNISIFLRAQWGSLRLRLSYFFATQNDSVKK